MRLYDRLLRNGLVVPEEWGKGAVAQFIPLKDNVEKSVVVVADSIVDPFFDGDRYAISGPRLISPPFENLFIEARDRKTGIQYGSLRVAHDLTDDNPYAQALRAFPKEAFPPDSRFATKPRWIVDSYVFAYSPSWRHGVPMGPLSVTKIAVDGQGHQARLEEGKAVALISGAEGLPLRSLGESWEPFFAHVMHLMNCRNITLVDAPMSRAERRERSRNSLPEVKFKVLAIGSIGGAKSTGSERKDIVGMTPMHLVRGHFATYTEAKPLFGKYTGTFWRPAHVRGTADAGTVYKDYKVKAGGAA